jgi:hypothetical protein
MLQGFPTWRMTGYPEVIHLDETGFSGKCLESLVIGKFPWTEG